MDAFQDAHYYNLPSQGNVYTCVNLSMTNGTNKVLYGILKRKVFCCEFSEDGDTLVPIVKEIPFTYIPAGAEIISMDAFNKTLDRDNFYIGISIIKVTAEQTKETYLNVYTEQEGEEKETLNLDSIAQNCLMLELNFTPYQLFHTYVISEFDLSKEIVWLLSGSDLKVHLFREDPLNHTYCESEIEDVFPEFNVLISVILWMDVKYSDDFKQRFTAYGCECGVMKLMMVDSFSGRVLRDFTEYYDAPVSCVRLFSFSKVLETKNIEIFTGVEGSRKLRLGENEKVPLHLLVVNTLRASAVFMNVQENGLSSKLCLPDSEKYDAAISSCLADIDMDGRPEIILGTFSQMMLVYKYDTQWKLFGKRRFSHAVHAIGYTDLSSDGVKELIIATMSGIHILQHKPMNVVKIFYERLSPLLKILGSFKEAPDEVQ